MFGSHNQPPSKDTHSGADDKAMNKSGKPPAPQTPQQHAACASQVPPSQTHASFARIPLPKSPEQAPASPVSALRSGLSTRGHPADNPFASAHNVYGTGAYDTNVYRQAPASSAGYLPAGQPGTPQPYSAAVSSSSSTTPHLSSLQQETKENKAATQPKGKKKLARVQLSKLATEPRTTTTTTTNKPAAVVPAPPPSKPAWTGKPDAWLEKARQDSTAKVVPVVDPPATPSPSQPPLVKKHIPAFKRLTPADVVPFRFVNIEPLQGRRRRGSAEAPSSAAAGASEQQLDQGWRGHPGVIVGVWDGVVGVVGTTSWGGKGADEKFDRAADRALYKKSFFPVFGAPGPVGDVAFDRATMRVDGPAAFADNTMLDGRSVRFIPAASFCEECSRFFRRGTREEVFLAKGSARNLEELLWYLAGLEYVPWKAVDHEGLKRWREFKAREGFAPALDVPLEARIA